MKLSRAFSILLCLGGIPLYVGCSLVSTPVQNTSATSSPSSQPASAKTSATAGTRAHNTRSAAKTGMASVSATLPLMTLQFHDLAVDVPVGWVRSDFTGGDYVGVRFTNPKDAAQQETVVFSGCVGCYTNSNGDAHPEQVIPHTAPVDVHVSQDGYSATYRFDAGTAHAGQGMVVASRDLAGYGYVEMTKVDSLPATADVVVSSLVFHG